ncbi:MAG: ATP-binding protein, partial [Actinobacteria bacterium]|nr:ATP-binding protein [Actinomycetota bacterium]
FGGGKTHAMLAAYHLCSGVPTRELPGVAEALAEAKVQGAVPKTRRAVLVGTKISASNPSVKPDGTVVRTLWGELAWQLGGAPAFAKVANDDANATSPGDTLRELFDEYGPCLILVDEWVAYARQLHDLDGQKAHAGGAFETQFSFAQALTESARAAKACALLVSLPASDGAMTVSGELVERVEDVEVGGVRGRTALARIGNVVGRIAEDWKPASADESTLVKFQRTRGVLRLMATVIHSLWRDNDRNPVIMPALIPVDDTRVRNELTRYLEDGWTPIIVSDVDGPTSLPAQVDAEDARLGAAMAARRVARTIYLGSAPSTRADQRGIEVRRINLGTMLPGEAPGVFADALRRLETRSSYLFRDEARYWFSTRPNLNSLASDRSNQIGRDLDKVRDEIRSRVSKGLGSPGQFARVHAFPAAPGDVPDETEARLVVLGPEVPHLRNTESEAIKEARRILASKGASPRIYQNTLVFLAPDKTRLADARPRNSANRPTRLLPVRCLRSSRG